MADAATTAALLRGHLEDAERALANAAWVLAGAPDLLPELAARRLFLAVASISTVLSEVPVTTTTPLTVPTR